MENPLQDVKQWYKSQPVVTRTYLTGSFLISIGISLGFLSPFSLFYTFNQTIFELDLWRPFTSLLFHGKFDFSFFFIMYFCYFSLSRVETEIFNQETLADFLWLCIYLSVGLTVIASFLPIYWISEGFIFGLLYIWCKRRPHESISLFWFRVQLKSGYLPWIYMGFKILSGGSVYVYLAGLLLAHLYIQIKDIWSLKYYKDYLPTPQFFKNLVHGNRNNQNQNQNQRQFNQEGPRFFRGGGVRIQ